MVGEEQPQLLAEAARLRQEDLGLRARQVGAEPDRERAQVGVAAHPRALHCEMRHAGAPVLDGGVAHVRAVAHEDLGDGVAEGARELGRCVAIDEGQLGARFHHDERVGEDRRARRVHEGQCL